jgi:quinol monooxygenase YgiN
MIRIICRFPIRRGDEASYLAEVKPCVLAARGEPGNLDYTLFFNEETNVATLLELYPDDAALQAHTEYPHFKEDFLALQKYYDGEPSVEMLRNPVV